MKARNTERIGFFFVSTAHRDLAEICAICSRFINHGNWYVRAEKGIAHYGCAKRAGWKKQTQHKRKRAQNPWKVSVEVAPKVIKVVRGGVVIKKRLA